MKIKEFFKKNAYIIVIIIALIIAGTNYLVYPLFIKSNMHVITVPVAINRINEATRITPELYKEAEIIDGTVPGNIIKDASKLNGLYVKQGVFIAPEGFFYTDYLASEEQQLGTIYSNLEKDEYAYNLACEARWNANNNIKVGQYINLYMSFNYAGYDEDYFNDATDKNETIKINEELVPLKSVFGQLAENVRVLAISQEGTNITLAVKEKDLANIRLAEHFIAQARTAASVSGEIIPLTYWDSSKTEEYQTKYYDIEQTINWIMENSQILQIPEEVEVNENEGDIVEAPDAVKEQQEDANKQIEENIEIETKADK